MSPKILPSFRLFTIFSFSFLVGIAIASYLSIHFGRSWPFFIFISLCLLFSALFNFIYKNYSLVVLTFAFILLLSGLVRYSNFDSKLKPNLVFNQKQSFEGKIADKPQIDISKQNAIVELSSGDKILVTLPHYPYFSYGDRLKFTATAEPLDKIDLPGYKKYLKKSLVVGTVTKIDSIDEVSHDRTGKERFINSIYAVSDHFEYSLNRLFSEPAASLSGGILLGLKKNMPEDFSNDLNTTGLTHLIALSGYNVTIIITALSFLLINYFSRKRILLIGSIFIILFVILTGAASSVIRAAIFSLLILFGRTVGRRADASNILLLAAALMVLINPYVLVNDLGFQLSFLAFAGLLYISPVLEKILSRPRYSFLPEWIRLPLTETCSAQLAVFPLILFNFGRLSLIAPLANVMVLWVVPFVMLMTFLSGLLGMIFLPLGKLVAFFTWPLLEYIIKIPELLSRVPFAAIDFTKGLLWIEVASFTGLLVGLHFAYKKYKISI